MPRNRFVLFLLVFMLAFMGCAAAETAAPAPTPEPEKIPLSVNGYELTYDDIMREGVEYYLPQDDFSVSENAVIFTKLVDETAIPMFTMYVYSNEGDTHTVLWSPAGDIIPVSFVFAPIPEELPEESRLLFQLDAEEAVHMLIATLELLQAPDGAQAAQLEETVISLQDYRFTFTLTSKARLQFVAEGNQAQFLLALEDGASLPVYTLECGAAEGSILVPVTDDTGAKVTLGFNMLPLPEGLDEETQSQFYQAQETVNEVLSTMQLSRAAE